jgi:hypothetical protein
MLCLLHAVLGYLRFAILHYVLFFVFLFSIISLAEIRVRGSMLSEDASHSVVSMPLYRSKSSGFVMAVPSSVPITPATSVLTLRNPFLEDELRGLNMLTALFTLSKRREKEGLSFEEVLNILLDPSKQSNVLHSHLQIADSDNVAAAMNGLFSSLPPNFDRRFPLMCSNETSLPEYEIGQPLLEINKKVRYYSWNSPFNDELEFGGNYNYGGLWRQSYIDRFFATEADSEGKVTFEQISTMPTALGKGCALQLGGGGQVDRFAEQIWPIWKNLLPEGPEFDEVRTLLEEFNGDAWADVTANDLDDGYVLANSWLFKVIDDVFGPTFAGTRFSIPSTASDTSIPLPRRGPNQRYAPLIVLLSRRMASPVIPSTATSRQGRRELRTMLNFEWVESDEAFAQIVRDALDHTLLRLGGFAARPWGLGERPNADFDAVGETFEEPLGSVPDGSLPSLNANIRMAKCGPIAVDSSIHFGVSGAIFSDADGEPVFAEHTKDQYELYRTYQVKPAPRLFRATIDCLQQQSGGNDGLGVGEIAGIAIASTVGGGLMVGLVVGLMRNNHASGAGDLNQKLSD